MGLGLGFGFRLDWVALALLQHPAAPGVPTAYVWGRRRRRRSGRRGG